MKKERIDTKYNIKVVGKKERNAIKSLMKTKRLNLE